MAIISLLLAFSYNITAFILCTNFKLMVEALTKIAGRHNDVFCRFTVCAFPQFPHGMSSDI